MIGFLFPREALVATVALLLTGEAALGKKNATLFMVGLNTVKSFSIVAERGSSIQLARDQSTLIAMADGTDRYHYVDSSKAMAPLQTPDDLRNAINDLVDKNPDLETLTFYIDDHGEGGSDPNNPVTANIILNGRFSKTANEMDAEAMSVARFADVIESSKLGPKRAIRFVATECESGGVHEIAFARPNTCSASATDYRSQSISVMSDDVYGHGFWQYMATGRESKTLFAAHYAALRDDEIGRNGHLGQLSSEAFMQKTLKRNAYDPGNYELDHQQTPHREAIFGKCGQQECSCDEFFKGLAATSAALDEYVSAAVPRTFDARLKDALSNVLTDSTQRLADYRRGLREFLADYEALKREWLLKDSLFKTRHRAEYTARFEKLRENYENATASYRVDLKALEYKKMLGDFLAVATPDKVETLKRLISCELEPI